MYQIDMAALVELPMLGLLREGPLHGYQLRQRLESLVGFVGSVSYGSLYPMFHTLERLGHVTRSSEELGRIVYRITPKGRQRFLQLMHDPDIPVTQKLLFFDAVPPAERKLILESHREEWSQRLAHYRQVREGVIIADVSHYRIALLNHEIERLSKDLVWLEQLIDEESADKEPTSSVRRVSRRSAQRSQKKRHS